MTVLKCELGILVIETRGHTYIDIARSQLATAALDQGADVTVFIDHDTLFDPLDVEALAEVARDTKGIVAAPYSERRMGGCMVGMVAAEEAVFFEGGGIYPAISFVGMGFTAIHKDVYSLLNAQPEYALVNSDNGLIRPYFKKLTVNGYWMTEDVSFCHAARSVGATIMIDTRIRLEHLGEHPFSIEDCSRRPEKKPSIRRRFKLDSR
jgi:hypothetical protein